MESQFRQPKKVINVEVNKQSIARNFGVGDNEVCYAKPGQPLTGYKVIYDRDTQRAYYLPTGLTDTVVSISIAGVLTHSTGTVDLGALAVTREEYVTLPGSFSSGSTINAKNERLEYQGGLYRWDGVLPKVVPAGSTPANSGGISNGAWLPVGYATLRGNLASESGAGMVGSNDGKTVQQHLDQNESDILGLKTTTTKIQSQHVNNHRYKVLFEIPLRFNAYDTVVAANGYTYLYASGHYIDHTANELWVFFAASGGDGASWFVVYDLTTLTEKTYFKAGMRWTKVFSLRYSGGSRYLYSRSMSTLWLAKFDVTTLPAPGSVLTEIASPRNQVKYAFAGIMGDEMLVPYDAPTTNTTSYTNTYNILDADTWAFKRSIRMDSVGAGNEYGTYPYQYKNQGTVMTPGGIAMAFGGMTASGDTSRSDTDLRIVQGVVLKTEEGVTLKSALFDPYMGMAILTASGYPATRFEHEGLFYDQTTGKLTTIWHYTDDPAGNFLIVEAFSGETDAFDMGGAAIIPRPKMGDIVRLFRSNFSVNYPNNPVTGDALPDVVDIIKMMINQDMGGVEWYTSNFSALTFNGSTLPGSCQVKLFRGTNTTFIMDVIGSGTNQRWLIQISGGNYVYTQMAMFSVRFMFTSTVGMFYGAGSPEGALAAGIGSTYHRTDGGGGTSFYVKESGSGNTGWAAK